MEITDIIMILAVFSGPIAAVRATRYLDDRKEVRSRKLSIYRTLMATRVHNLSQSHVEALNSIDLAFSNKGREKSVREAWRAYLDHLSDKNYTVDQWVIRRVDLLTNLLDKMGKSLGYDFDSVHLKKGIYHPDFYGNIENDHERIRIGLRDLLDGKRDIRMHVVNLPNENGSADQD